MPPVDWNDRDERERAIAAKWAEACDKIKELEEENKLLKMVIPVIDGLITYAPPPMIEWKEISKMARHLKDELNTRGIVWD
jgi:hypothetical protein